MMDHTHYRSAIMADPRDPNAELREHRDACPECRAFSEQLLRFETRLERALRVEILPKADVLPFGPKASAAARGPRRWMAMAASVLLGLVIAGGVWLTLPQRSLAADVVAHMAGEPDAWRRTEVSVPDSKLNAVLQESKLRLKPGTDIVSYASSCDFRGHKVPHLVVQTPSGPVTVMVLVHEPARKSTQFDEQGYRGTIVPVPGHGSLAVLMRDSGAGSGDIERIAARVDDSIVWTR
ncbi:MAG: DUF3379 domain-containing protein [Pseudomonadota bacterium]|nr:DUF3379 domain-containing protein [Pseudomonadota bacterium]